MRLAVVVPFLNEEGYLERTLASIAGQTHPPGRLVLVDDGSTDSSPAIARKFADGHAWAELMTLGPRPPSRDRLARAHVVHAFSAGAARIGSDADVIAKLDADIDFPPPTFATLLTELEADDRLGIAGAFLSSEQDGRIVRERPPAEHVRGATKFYRRECFEAITPLSEMLGWDTIDEAKARLAGWTVRSVAIPGGDPLHLRTTGSHDGLVRGFSRHGLCAWNYGAHPLAVALGAVARMPERPRVLGGLAYFGGWLSAGVRRLPRAEPDVRREMRRSQLERIKREARQRLGREDPCAS
jgi:poly-beta-1,6-N-acetyl-D-glucosamine synthase